MACVNVFTIYLKQTLKYVLPEKFIITAIELLHKTIFAANFSLKRTLKRVQERFYYPNLKKKHNYQILS